MRTTANNDKVLLGVSGGVDSTAAALLLLKRGFDVSGMYFDITGTGKGRAEAENALKEAYSSADRAFGSDKFIYIDAKSEFEKKVISYFCNSYAGGATPNPCVMCNPLVKFRYLTETADRIGARYIATGHYAAIYRDPTSGIWYIKKSSSSKDQSYMLCRLGQDVISRTIFPLEDMADKGETRRLAAQAGISNADLKDSQEICFIEEGKSYIDFLKERMTFAEGDFTDIEGNPIARHAGIVNYTVGQRKGLGVTFGKPMFVVSIDAGKNTVVLGSNDDLFTSRVTATKPYFSGFGDKLPRELKGKHLSVKLRYTAKPAEAVVDQAEDGTITVEFTEKQRAATRGQALVIYDGELLVGCGVIA